LPQQALRQHLELFAKQRRGKALAPNLLLQRVAQVQAAVLGLERAVGLEALLQGGGVEPFAADLLEGGGKGGQLIGGNGAAGRGSVATKAQQHAGVALGDQIECVAQVKTHDRAP